MCSILTLNRIEKYCNVFSITYKKYGSDGKSITIASKTAKNNCCLKTLKRTLVLVKYRDGSRTAATSKMEHFGIIVNG